MLPVNGSIKLRHAAIAFLFLLLPGILCSGQEKILDSLFTFRPGTIRTGKALESITKQTGYNFTYDSRLVDSERKIDADFRNVPLRDILKQIIGNDSLVFSVIDKYIVISRPEVRHVQVSDTSSGKPDVISGIITDEETGEPLPFATIGFMSQPKGTVTNRNGEFGLSVPPELINDTIAVSFLGYSGRKIPVKQAAGSFLKISMKREYYSIPEIIIRNQIPQEIINKSRKAIQRNYGETPAMMTAFYREGIFRKSELQTYSEAVIRIFKSAYSGSLLGDQMKVYKSRKIENVSVTDTLAIRLKAGLSTCLDLDGVRNTFDFIDPPFMQDYNYRLTDIVNYDNESAYAIEFSQKENAVLPLFEGTIYINTNDFGICKADFRISPSQISKIKESFITSSSGGFTTWPVSVNYSVSYRKVNGRYYLNHVRGDLVFNSKQRKKLFSTQFKVFFELAITGADLKNVKRFERDELAPVHSIFSKTINSYDPAFWGSQDFLKPEDDLLQALRNLKVKLQEFGE